MTRRACNDSGAIAVDLLRAMQAPDALVERFARSVSRGESLVALEQDPFYPWIAAATGVPFSDLVAATLERLVRQLDADAIDHDLLDAALDAASRSLELDADPEELQQLIHACQTLADDPPKGYRSSHLHLLVRAARLTTYAITAAEALYSVRHRLSAQRLARARHMAAMLGGAQNAFVGAQEGPLCLPLSPDETGVEEDLFFVAAACAEIWPIFSSPNFALADT